MLGFRLRWVGDGVHDFTFMDLLTIVNQSPAHSATVRHLDPDTHTWGLQEQLQATIFDALAGISWQLGGDKSNKPKPLPRPGVDGYKQDNSGTDDSSATAESTPAVDDRDPFDENGTGGVFRGEATPIDELNEWLGWTTNPQEQEPTAEPYSRNELIIADYNTGTTTYKQLAAKHGVSASTVGRIIRAAR